MVASKFRIASKSLNKLFACRASGSARDGETSMVNLCTWQLLRESVSCCTARAVITVVLGELGPSKKNQHGMKMDEKGTKFGPENK